MKIIYKVESLLSISPKNFIFVFYNIMIKGNSNFVISIDDYCKKKVIKKMAINDSDLCRLKKQMDKQKMFSHIMLYNDIFKIPVILHSQDNYFLMDYIHNAKNCINLLEQITQRQLDWFTNQLISFIEKNISRSTFYQIDDKIIEKVDDIILKCNIDKKKYFQYDAKNIIIPVGECHGDLTLSNVLVNYDKIYLIDFLDNFVETPLQDIVKLRQDTKYYWTLDLYEGIIDKNSIRIKLNYMDNLIHSYFSRYEFYNKHYDIFQTINLLRIVPYIKTEQMLSNILKYIEDIYNERNNTSGKKNTSQ